jgi:hypothetical protein
MEEEFPVAHANTKNALRLLVSNCLDMQQDHEAARRMRVTFKAWIQQWATVRMCGPRRSGHTSAMVTVARERFEEPKFIVLNDVARGMLLEDFDVSKREVFTHYDFKQKMVGMQADGVFVDCASFMSSSKQDELFSLCGSLFVGRQQCCLAFLE